jgi:hypothetical protein
MSQRLARETMRRAFSNPCFAVTLPGTTVMARTSSSGEFSASMRAMASSVPGSVSMMIFLDAAAAGIDNAKINTVEKIAVMRRFLGTPKQWRVGTRTDLTLQITGFGNRAEPSRAESHCQDETRIHLSSCLPYNCTATHMARRFSACDPAPKGASNWSACGIAEAMP